MQSHDHYEHYFEQLARANDELDKWRANVAWAKRHMSKVDSTPSGLFQCWAAIYKQRKSKLLAKQLDVIIPGAYVLRDKTWPTTGPMKEKIVFRDSGTVAIFMLFKESHEEENHELLSPIVSISKSLADVYRMDGPFPWEMKTDH